MRDDSILSDQCPHCGKHGGFGYIHDLNAPDDYRTCDYCGKSSPIPDEQLEVEKDS